MQPPTDTAIPAPRGDEDALYRAHHAELRRAVARAVNAPRELIEDACQTAWTMLLRNQPDRYAIVAGYVSSRSTRSTDWRRPSDETHASNASAPTAATGTT